MGVVAMPGLVTKLARWILRVASIRDRVSQVSRLCSNNATHVIGIVKAKNSAMPALL
jgi:hypothetical protein